MLDDKKPKMQQRYKDVTNAPAPAAPTDQLPTDAEEAWRVGFQQGKAQGYGDGLVDGTELGLDVAQGAIAAILSQPVFATWAEA